MDLVSTVFLGFLVVFVMMFVLWLWHLRLRNAGTVDIGWGLGFIFLTLVYISQGEGFTLRNGFGLFMVSVWGLRLSLFLIKRLQHDNKEDARYQTLRNNWRTQQSLKFFFFFEFQALLQVILSTPFLAVSRNPQQQLSLVEIVGFVIWLAGVVGEAISDKQLAQFKTNPANKGKVCQLGLWNYSRHPNYFFECVVWVGFFVLALGSQWGWISIISPLIMTYLITNVSGVPLAEAQSLKSRGNLYREYQRTTSVLIPWFKRSYL